MAQGGVLPHYQLGRAGKRGKIVIDEADFDALLERMKVSGPRHEDEGELKSIK